MLAIVDPRNATAALAYLTLIEHLDYARPAEGINDVLEPLIGTPLNVRVYVDVQYPVTWGWAYGNANSILFMSGVRTARTASVLVRSWIEAPYLTEVKYYTSAIEDWTRSIWSKALTDGFQQRTTVAIAGHSLGGAIGFGVAEEAGNRWNTSSVLTCTFGAPKVIGPAYRLRGNVSHTRYSNPGDNVPSLPPTSDRATLIYAGLTRAQQQSLQTWRHPCGVNILHDDGTLTQSDTDRPSDVIGMSTLLPLFNSRVTGIFGPAHFTLNYRQLLVARIARSAAQTAAETVYNSASPTAPEMPAQVSPVVVPPLLPQVEINRQVVTARENAVIRDAVALNIPDRYRMKVKKDKGVYYVAWMGKEIAWGPSRKKAGAVARHFNRFLAVYQGVGISQSNVLVQALIEYLTVAADPAGPLKPTLYDGGSTPQAFGSVVDLDIFGIEFMPMIVP